LKNKIHQISPKILVALVTVFAVMLMLSGLAQAQTVYRLVGPDGRITFSDKPSAAADKVTPINVGDKPMGSGGAALPFELRQVASKYPVTLYTSSNCAPCNAGRALLNNRGIPFAEKTITSSEDADSLRRISGENSLPFLTIGAQQIKGYSDSEWTPFLDAAGYPQTSTLPANYRNPVAAPLVAVQKPVAAVKPEDTQTQPEPIRPLIDTPANPAGIQF
jgi:glutaredoxin